MKKIFTCCSLLSIVFSSCSHYRTLIGRAKPVYFTADPSVFADTVPPALVPSQIVHYDILAGFPDGSQLIELQKQQTREAIIHKPTFFYIGQDMFLVYPGEHIFIDGKYDHTFLRTDGNKRRNRELTFFTTFHKLAKGPGVPMATGYNLQTILDLEQQQKDKIAKAESASMLLFDSLLKASHVSKKFKRLTRGYARNRYDGSLFWLYGINRDTLRAHGLYFQKYKQLLPAVNGLTKKVQLNSHVGSLLDGMVREMFPESSSWYMDEEMFGKRFDSVETYFKGRSRDYLLSRMMYTGYSKGLKAADGYAGKYKRYSINKNYRKIAINAKYERERKVKDTTTTANILLARDGESTFNLENILGQHKGKYILVDMWASWCGPCRNEIPYLKQLMQKYPEQEITFLSISVDKQRWDWQRAIREMDTQSMNNYLLINAVKASFSKQFHINAIPRYLLFDKEGKIINADTPHPSDPELGILLDKLILNNKGYL